MPLALPRLVGLAWQPRPVPTYTAPAALADPARATVGDFATVFLGGLLVSHKPTTVRRYEHIYRTYLGPTLGHCCSVP